MKKRLLQLFLFLWTCCLGTYAQCDFSSTSFPNGAFIKQVTDYGATPDDPSDNDYYAIIKTIEEVQRYINANPGYYGIVQFPDGQYDIGEMIGGEMKFYDTANLIPVSSPSTYTYYNGTGTFMDVRNMKITGMSSCSKAVIKYKDGYRYGVDGSTLLQIGTVFRFNMSANLMIQNFEIDGNSENLEYIGLPHATYTPTHTGIGIYSGSFNDSSYRYCIEINNCYVHSFGYDGILINFSVTPQAAYYNGIIRNTIASNCGRQNLTLGQGTNIHILNSEFKYAGKFNIEGYNNDEIHTETNNPYRFAANSNVQIEPNPTIRIKNVTFDSCKIAYDVTGAGPSLAIAGGTPNPLNIDNLVFNDCEIKSHQAAVEMLYSGNRNFVFNRCLFEGAMLANFSSSASMPALYADQICKFNQCVFKTGSQTSAGWPIVWSRGQMRFEGCEFYTRQNPIYNNNSTTPYVIDTLVDCTFYYDYGTNFTALPRAFFADVFFKGNNNFDITDGCVPQTTALSQNRNEDVENFVVSGNTDPLEPFEMKFTNGYRVYAPKSSSGNIILGQYPCEYLSVTIGNGISASEIACFSNSLDNFNTDYSDLYINENTTVIVKKGGRLRLGGNAYLSGKIIVENGGKLQYLTGHTLYYSSVLSTPNIVVEPGGIVTGTPNHVSILPASLQPPSSALLTSNPCESFAAKPVKGNVPEISAISHFEVYPNPNSTKLFKLKLAPNNHATNKVVVTDINGKVIKSFDVNPVEPVSLNLEKEISVSAQVLIFTLYGDGHKIDTKKIIYAR